MIKPLGVPDRVFVQHEDKPVQTTSVVGRWTSEGAEVVTTNASDGIHATLHCPRRPVARVILRWDRSFPAQTLFLGDAWERGYGDLQWRHLQPERIMPWYFAAHDPHQEGTFMAGVKTQPSAMCFWAVDEQGISLWLDVRNGGLPSIPGDRLIELATVVSIHSPQRPFVALREFCAKLCPSPKRPANPRPICGNNNWYYAYGQNFDHQQVLRDAGLLADLAAGHANKPYCVIDAGWSPGGGCPGGPWTHGLHDKFPDMQGLARQINELGVLPGIWMRLTALSTVHDERLLRKGPQRSVEKALDLTLPEVHDLARADIGRIRGWGYELIKHDFSCWDFTARWGLDWGAELTDPAWHWADQSLTNAEVLLRWYRTLREAAGDAVLIGCNTIGHLGAGLFELQRTGDDTSGRIWERTRKMGINTLAFRLPQQNTFFQCDADCVAHTEHTPWEKDRQFLELVAASGTPLFVSADPVKIAPEVKRAMQQAMQLALSGGTNGTGDVEPLDWLTTTCPRQWRVGGESRTFDWVENLGAWPMKC